MLNAILTSSSAIDSLVEKMSTELATQAVLFIHNSGQILARSGKLQEEEYPTVAALLAGMVAAGTSLMSAASNDSPEEDRKRFSCEYRSGGIYAVAVGESYWIASVYEEILNPGLLRMRLRKYAEILEKINTPQALFTKPGCDPAPVLNMPEANFENITDEEIEELFQSRL